MASEDPLVAIARSPMHSRQVAAIAILTACTAAEGFDVFAISFAAPAIADAWQVNRAVLGIALAMDLVGLGVGAILLGLVADRLGRKPVILTCLFVMATGMWLASRATDIAMLSGARLYTGLGIGGLLATSSALVAEYSNDRKRSLAITLMIGGFSIGAIIGGVSASEILARTDRWQAVFEVGALSTAILLAPAILFVPESLVFLCRRQPERALVRINRILEQQRRPALGALPSRTPPNGEPPEEAGRDLRQAAFLLTLAFFMYMVPLYFLMKWIPKLVADMGHTASWAGLVLVWAHVGGLAGTAAIGFLSQKCDMRSLVAGALVLGAAAVAQFGLLSTELQTLTIVSAAAGFFIIGANSGFYAILAQSFPPQSRAGGTGFVIGAGRAGSAAGPIAAGLLLHAGWPLGAVSSAMACGCLIAALSIIRSRPAAVAA